MDKEHLSKRTVMIIAKVLASVPFVWLAAGFVEMFFFSHSYVLIALAVVCIVAVLATFWYVFTKEFADIIQKKYDDWMKEQ